MIGDGWIRLSGGLDMKEAYFRKNGILRILTLGMMLLILLFGSLCLSACSSKDTAADEDEEMEEFKKDLEKKKEKKKKEDSKKDTDSDEEGSETETEDEPESETDAAADPAEAKRALTEYARGLNYIKGMTAEYETIQSRGSYEYQTDASDAPLGYFEYLIDDFDGDGQVELLLPELVGPDKITLSMYEYTDKVELSATCDYNDTVFEGDYNNTFCFIYDYDDLIRIGLFGDGSVYNTADGAFLQFCGYKYDGASFVLEGSCSYAGSDGEEDGSFSDNLRKCGIFADWEDIFADNAEWTVLKATGGYRLFSLVVRTGDVEYKDGEFIPFYLERYATYNGMSVFEELYARESYIFPDSSYRELTEADLAGLSNEELRRGRNEIAARHGRRFDDKELQAYFDSKAWYRGTIDPDDFNMQVQLNKTERDNMDFIKKHEK